jgi:hypothetical protein
MKLQRNKKKFKTKNPLSITRNLRENLQAWELECQAKLAVGQRLGYEELALYMYWVGNLAQETNSGLAANRIDGHEVVLNKAISCLAAATYNPDQNARFDSIAQLKCYANSAFQTAAMDVGRRQFMTLPWNNGKQTLTRDEKKQLRVKRIIDNPVAGPHCVDVFMDSRSGFDRLEQQELQTKLKQLLTDVLSRCKQEKYVQVLHLDMQGMKGPQIAAALGTSHANARQLLSRAKKYVAQAILARPDARELMEELMGSQIYNRCEIITCHSKVTRARAVDLLDEPTDSQFALCMVA